MNHQYDEGMTRSFVARCDACDHAIEGLRWKCVSRFDFDLCQPCMAALGHTMLAQGHIFLQMPSRTPVSWRNFYLRGTPTVAADTHLDFICDNCDAVIEADRYKCAHCLDFHLCPGCYHTDGHGCRRHDETHWFFRMPRHALVADAQCTLRPQHGTTHGVTIHRMVEPQLRDVLHLEREAFGEHAWPERYLRSQQDPRTNHYIDVAMARGAVVGYVTYRMTKHESGHEEWAPWESFELTSIAVDARHRGLGIGTTLVQHILTQARHRRACQVARLHVRVDNTHALHLYHKHGFHTTSRVDSYYGAGEDAFTMEATL